MDSAGSTTFFNYWGKANPRFAVPADWHPLPFHALDVTAVCAEYLDAQPRLLNYFSQQLGLDDAATRGWILFWIALHDLGKFATSFQNMRPDLLDRLQHRSSSLVYGNVPRHDTLGLLLWKSRLLEHHDVLGLGKGARFLRKSIDPWVAAVTGHHGQPPAVVHFHRTQHFVEQDELAAVAFIREARSLFLPDNMLDQVLAIGEDALEDAGLKASWWLAGLAVAADWLGSNTAHFHYQPGPLALTDYFESARKRAVRALDDAGLRPVPAAPLSSLAGLFGWKSEPDSAWTPTPLQAWAASVDLPQEPQLFLLEDVTGAGKTEAALMLVHRLMVAGLADGAFMGLPTMATTNAMYKRMSSVASNLFAKNSFPSLTLAHGKRDLVHGFRDSIVAGGNVEVNGMGREDTASARCAAWLADNNKKALLANLGVGTIDQALMAILHARHQSLRMLGLFGKVLVVDEVHACDAYMQRLLEALLEFHAAAGGSAILLSATLPNTMKTALTSAYLRGRDHPRTRSEDQQGYPLATHVHGGTQSHVVLGSRPSVCRRVNVIYRDSVDDVRHDISAALQRGQCVCWIRNTIADAMEAWRLFAAQLPKDCVQLFHARYTMADRLRIECRVLDAFGPTSQSHQRSGRLVIATQVVEQSLDLCFDLLVTDLAPMDRVIQRAGRLQRHQRDRAGNTIQGLDQRGGARLIVHGPKWTESPDAEWYTRFSRGSAFVYPDPAHAWHTARLLQEGGYVMPDDARRLVEGVFGEGAEELLPEALQPASERATGKSCADRNLAHSSHLRRNLGYRRGDVGEWLADDVAIGVDALDEWEVGAQTRLGEPGTCLRLVTRDEHGVLVPWDRETRPDWQASSLQVPMRLAEKVSCDIALIPGMEAALESMPDKGKWSSVALLDAEGRSSGGDHSFQYDAIRGLTLEAG